jgi:CubicO group peptidase (beta-lactamase class C family)
MRNPLRALVFVALTVVALTAVGPQAAEIAPLRNTQALQVLTDDLESSIPRLMAEAHIPGLQIALIRDGKIAWHGSFGLKNAETQAPVTDDTIFEAASLTKPFFAYYAMKLAEQGVIDLDKPILGYVPREAVEQGLGHSLDEPGFHRDWFEKITARHVLSHSSGMPHGESGRPYPLFFEPGTQWRYSADGYFFLQKAVEHIKGDKLENLMQKEVLDPLGMTHSCLVWRDDYEATMANGHSFFGHPEEFRKRTEAHAAATLYTTAEDYAKFVCAVLNGEGLKPETLKEMLTKQIDMNTEKGLGWSLGFGTQDDANGRAIWQWGDYGIFRNYIIAYPLQKTGVVYLTNSFNGLSICSDLVAQSVGGEATGCRDLNYRPYDSLAVRLAWALKTEGPKAMDELPELLRTHPGGLSASDIGFVAAVLDEEKLTAEVVSLLEYNVGEHPRSGEARLDLAKAYIEAGRLPQAKAELEKARQADENKVDPGAIDWNLGYIRALESPALVAETDLEKLAGEYGPRIVQLKDGRLLYRREGGAFPDFRPLAPLSKDTFVLVGLRYFRMRFEVDEKGNGVKIVGLYDDGRRDETPRTK